MKENEFIQTIEALENLDDKQLISQIKILHNMILDDKLSFENDSFEEIVNHLAYQIDFFDPNANSSDDTLFGVDKLRFLLKQKSEELTSILQNKKL